MSEEILRKVESWSWDAGVIGLGYVGLPLVVALARAGVDVTGYDVKRSVAEELNAGRSHIDDVSDADLAEIAERTTFSADVSALADRDVIFICVPTPLKLGKLPDMSYIESAVEAAASVLRAGQVLLLESTTFPGTTQNIVLPMLTARGLELDRDFLLAYSPERVDPSNESFRTANIPRIVGGASEASTRAAAAIYGRFVEKVYPVTDASTAEMAKLLENTFRWVNIALVNEMAAVARAIGVNIWEVIDAAATKPFGYMPFYPGPGVGGHCIPLDPFYLQWAARVTGEGTRFVELAETINARMPRVVVERAQEVLNDEAKALRGAKVLVLGVAYKPNVSDHRESPALEVIKLLQRAGADVAFHDPFVAELHDVGIDMEGTPLTEAAVRAADLVLVTCDHDGVDYAMVAREARTIFDTRNAFARRGVSADSLRVL